MGLLNFLGIETRSGSVGSAGGTSPLPGIMPPARSSSSDVSVNRALTLPAVFSAFTVLTTAASQLTLDAYRIDAETGIRRKLTGSQAPALVSRPDVNRPLSEFIERTVFDLAATGNAYWRVYRNPNGAAATAEVLNPLGISIRYDKDGRKLYDYANGASGSQTFTAQQVEHLRYLSVPGSVYGLGPIQAARSMLGGALNLTDYADNWFGKSGVPAGGTLSTDLQLTTDEAAVWRSTWIKSVAENGIGITGKGLKFEPTMISNADAQFLETRQFSVTDVARLFRIPATYLLAEVNGSSMTYSNLEQVDTAFVKYGLMKYLIPIEEALSDILVRGQVAKFDLDGLLRPDAKSQAEIHSTYLSLGVMTVNEARAEKGWGPIAGGDELKAQSSDTSNVSPTNEVTND